jgi:hypothetical protein
MEGTQAVIKKNVLNYQSTGGRSPIPKDPSIKILSLFKAKKDNI